DSRDSGPGSSRQDRAPALGERHREDEAGPAHRGTQLERTLMRARDLAADRETQARPDGLAAVSRAAEERLEDALDVVRRDAGPLVGDHELRSPRSATPLHLHHRTAWRV